MVDAALGRAVFPAAVPDLGTLPELRHGPALDLGLVDLDGAPVHPGHDVLLEAQRGQRHEDGEPEDRQARAIEAHAPRLERRELVAAREAQEEQDGRHQHDDVQALVDERRGPVHEVQEDQAQPRLETNVPLQRGHQIADDHHHAREGDAVAEEGQELSAQVSIDDVERVAPVDPPASRPHPARRGHGGTARSRRPIDAPPRFTAPRDRGPEGPLEQRDQRHRALLEIRPEQVEGQRAHDQVRPPHREPGRDPSGVPDVLAERQGDVVEEHDGQEGDEGTPAAAAVGTDAQGHSQDAEDDARRRYRELLVDLHQVGVRIALVPRGVARGLAQLGQSHLAIALRRAPLLDQGILQHERDVVQAEAHLPVLLERGGAGLVDGAVDEPQRDPAVHFVREQPSLVRRDEALLLGLPLVRYEHVAERHLVGSDLVHVDDEVPEGVVEHALLDPHGRLGPDDLEHERLERVVALGDGVDHQVGGQGRDGHPEGRHGPQKAERAHPAGLERHDLHVGGQAAERDQDRQQEADGDGEHQDRRGDVDQHHEDEVDRNALVDDEVGQVEDPVDQQEEREHEQAEPERGDELLPDVAVEDSHEPVPWRSFYGTPRGV